jgi:hypothetical protein
MASEKWQQARLIPTSGINGADEAERRATSALLAVMGSVREFGAAMVRPLGAPAGALQCFIEVPFECGERTIYPDGLLQVSRAGRTWTALVEVKTGSAELEAPQVEAYLPLARQSGYAVVLTISNQIAPAPGGHPIDVDRRRLRRVALHHLSWAEVMTVAVQQRVHRGVSDPDQAWILGELIRYLEHPRSGALDFSDMGGAWVMVRDAVAAGTLRESTRELSQVISRWEQLLRFAALRLGRELGADVQVQLSRREAADPSIRFASQARLLVAAGYVDGTLRIPRAIAPVEVSVDLRAGRVTVSAEVAAPREGRATTRVNWLTRQLKDAPDGLRVDAFTLGSRSSRSALLRAVRDNPSVLVDDPKRELRMFRLAASSPMGTKRAAGRGGFIDSVLSAIDGFYEAVLQPLRPWISKAPQLPAGGQTAAEEAGIEIDAPPRDLLERVDEASDDPATVEDETVPAALSRPAAQAAQDQLECPLPVALDAELEQPPTQESAAAANTDQDELVSWEAAQARLDHEREPQAGEPMGDDAPRADAEAELRNGVPREAAALAELGSNGA